ncbi:MAG: hypothetical protein MZU97_04975 [Bacillus subtilis]|nr:hypothetical protein [Bacillus subtilis]
MDKEFKNRGKEQNADANNHPKTAFVEAPKKGNRRERAKISKGERSCDGSTIRQIAPFLGNRREYPKGRKSESCIDICDHVKKSAIKRLLDITILYYSNIDEHALPYAIQIRKRKNRC